MKLGKESRIINYLHEIYRVPDTIMDNAIARASELSHKIVSDQPSKRTVFNKKRVNFFKKFINNHSLNTSLDPWLKKLVDFSSNKEDIYTNEEMESNWPSHEAVLKKILFSKEYEDNTIAIEVPIW